LQDHLEAIVQYECLQPITLYGRLNLLSKALIDARWLLRKDGDGATNHFESAGFVRSRAGVAYPDIQFHFLPVAIRYDSKASAPCHDFQMHVGPMRSASRGHVRLRSNDSAQAPSIQFNYLSAAEDLADFRHCIRLTREIVAQAAFRPLRGRELAPGENVVDDDALDEFIRNNVESAYHSCGTCQMGRVDDPHAVVDPQCKVIGVQGLRVADSPIFPRITNGNLNAPSIMVGEKADDHVLGRTPLAPSTLQP
jgi:choline dehydrogenase